MTFKSLFPARVGFFFSASVFLVPVAASAGDFRFTQIEVAVESADGAPSEVEVPASVKSVPTRVRVADARVVSKVVLSRAAADAAEKKTAEKLPAEVVAQEGASQPAGEKKEALPEEISRPILVAPLQDVDLAGGEDIPILPGVDSPFNPPYIPRQQEQADASEDPGVLPPLPLEPLPAKGGKSGQPQASVPSAPPAALPVDLTKLPIQKATALGPVPGAPAQSRSQPSNPAKVMASRNAPEGDSGEAYYSELETDALLNGADSWRFVRPMMGSTW